MEYIIIGILLCYIIILHFQLSKKNKLIETMIGKLTKLEKDWDTDHVLNLIEKLRVVSSETTVKQDKLFDEKVLNFIFTSENEAKIFVHYTRDENTARKIFQEGFKFVDSFEKTAEQIINDTVDLTYKHNIRKYYGKYIIIICIANDIYDHYDNEIKKMDKHFAQVEQVLTEIPSCFNENQDEIFTLSKHFIRGYINYETGVIEKNPEFDLHFNSQAFGQNIERIKSTG